MYGKCFKTIRKKRTMYAGLFLGVWLGFAGCVNPADRPEVTNTPVPAVTEGVNPTLSPGPVSGTPVPAVTKPAARPTVAPTAGPTAGPEMTPPVSVVPTECPDVTSVITPECTATPIISEGDIAAQPSSAPEVTPVVLPEPTVTPSPLPTARPEYDTLMQNGWQRTEDFFGCREIFFSGKFDDAESVIGEGSYEFSYRAVSDVSVLLRIIGEEGVGLQPFLDELRKKRPECLITQEGQGDYSYSYVEGKTQVSGRIYDCGSAETINRMRVEFYSLAGTDIQTEGYGFYLR